MVDVSGVVFDSAAAEPSVEGPMGPPPTCLGPFISTSLSQSDSPSSFLSSLSFSARAADVRVDEGVF